MANRPLDITSICPKVTSKDTRGNTLLLGNYKSNEIPQKYDLNISYAQ
jgi:hypothetical protein